jgi:hypothetical protein
MSDSPMVTTQRTGAGDRLAAMAAMAIAALTILSGAVFAAALVLAPFRLLWLAAAIDLVAIGLS